MNIQKIAAFSLNDAGGNPAGVVLSDTMPEAKDMQVVAADVGYSETVFAAPQENGLRVRYFAPEAEVAFCGHATIALGAALGAAKGAGTYQLQLNDAKISVDAFQENGNWSATLTSPNTRYETPNVELRAQALALFGWDESDLANDLDVTVINGGARHLLIPLKDHMLLQDMAYDFNAGANLMQAFELVTINLVWRENSNVIHSRNPFAGHGVYEDPATGAAAAALAGYIRDAKGADQSFTIYQGADMGVPSRLKVTPIKGKGQPIMITGETRMITE
ncbi:MAG: PhzF family phenazine biosynthesis isomerase [Rhodobacterales bacterium]